MILVSALSVALLGALAETTAQDATPAASPAATRAVDVVLRDVGGQEVGRATFAETPDDVVYIDVEVEGLAPGEHGIHVHAVGVCDPTGDMPFASAGGHYNPTGAAHGGPPAMGATGTPATWATSRSATTGRAGCRSSPTDSASTSWATPTAARWWSTPTGTTCRPTPPATAAAGSPAA